MEGNFDYVDDLAILANYGPAFFAYNTASIMSALGIGPSNFFNGCLLPWRNALTSAPYGVSLSDFGELVTNSMKLTFAGFWWKPSYALEGN
jgi:hypothetical protein